MPWVRQAAWVALNKRLDQQLSLILNLDERVQKNLQELSKKCDAPRVRLGRHICYWYMAESVDVGEALEQLASRIGLRFGLDPAHGARVALERITPDAAAPTKPAPRSKRRK